MKYNLQTKLGIFLGVPKAPLYTTSKGWDEYDANCKKFMPIRWWIYSDCYDFLYEVVNFIPSKIQSAIYFLSNLKRSSHSLRTSVSLGGYSDLVTMIPDALMYSIIDFVEIECFWMMALCSQEGKDDKVLVEYGSQSYLKRKLFPIKISNEDRGMYGIQWLNFQKENCVDGSVYDELIDAYNFAKVRYFTFDVYEESGFAKKFFSEDGVVELPMSFREEKKQYYDAMNKIEAEYDDLTTKHCGNIVKNRKYMWT